MLRLVFVTSHPIQYQVPVFRHLAARDDLNFLVLFAMLPDAAAQGAGFGVAFEWDLPLLEGYSYGVLENVSPQPGVTSFRGCDTPDIYAQFQHLRPDAVVVNGWVVKTCLQALWACKRLGIPCIVRGEANDIRPRAWWKRALQRQLVRQYAAVLPIGSANHDFYGRRGVAEEAMFDALYCVENERFAGVKEDTAKRSELRKRWGIPEDGFSFLFCGKFETKKHPVELLEAFGKATRSTTSMHLLMVGDGELRHRCEMMARQEKLSVTFAGFLNQRKIVEAYAASDMLVLPSDHGETWGLVVNEAMACGLPAIVSDQVGCAEDLIEEGVTGWTFPFGEWEKLPGLLTRAAGRPGAAKTMSEACRSRIARYSPAAAAEGIVKAAQYVAGSARKS